MFGEASKFRTKETALALLNDLRALLVEGKAATQEDICAALESQGHLLNQSKISRLLRKIGAVKSKNEQGQIVYRLPHEPAPPATSSQLSNLIIDVVANEVIIIVQTSPGSAQLIARVLDYHKEEIEVLATIAGDDTIFVAPKSVEKIDHSVKKINKLLLLNK
jgi:transcriptional regulator of arginine metabolism